MLDWVKLPPLWQIIVCAIIAIPIMARFIRRVVRDFEQEQAQDDRLPESWWQEQRARREAAAAQAAAAPPPPPPARTRRPRKKKAPKEAAAPKKPRASKKKKANLTYWEHLTQDDDDAPIS